MTNIEWTDETWTPFRAWGNEREALGWACEKVSEGCQHCYAETINRRLGTGLPYSVKAVEKSGGEHYLDEKSLLKPLSWKKPRRIFVSSMTDIFGDWVPFEWLDRVFAVMALTPQHTYQVLTKRPERMRAYFAEGLQSRTGQRIDYPMGLIEWWTEAISQSRSRLVEETIWNLTIPLPNVWLGTSVENQHWADIRIPELLATPAAVRFLSCEPLLGPLDFHEWFELWRCPDCGNQWRASSIRMYGPDGSFRRMRPGVCQAPDRSGIGLCCADGKVDGLHWVIVGGESGPKARPFDLAWARSIVSQCRAAGVACFVKQLGAKPYARWLETVTHPVFDDGDPGYHEEEHLEPIRLRSRKGGDMSEWPEDLRVREWPR